MVAPSLPALRKSPVDSIIAGHFVDFPELPPAKRRTKALNSGLYGQIVIFQASEYLQAKWLIPDLGIWIQCFSLYAAIILTKHSERQTSLLLYQSSIAKLSQKFNWPSRVIYDTSYCQEAAAKQGKQTGQRLNRACMPSASWAWLSVTKVGVLSVTRSRI